MNPNDVNIPPEQNQPTPLVDADTLFQKDPQPFFTETNPKTLGKKKIIILATAVFVLLIGGLGFALAYDSSDSALKNGTSLEFTSGSEANDSNISDTDGQPGLEDQNTPTEETTDSTTGSETTSGDNATNNTSPVTPPSSGGSGPSPSTGDTTVGPKTYTIDYSSSCYSPANQTIKQGDTIKFTNSSNKNMWPASDNHPSHTIYPEFDPDTSITPGSSWSFTFTKTGSWDYHDHNKPGCTGTITVN